MDAADLTPDQERACREALTAMVREGVRLSKERLRVRAKVKAAAAAAALRAYRDGRFELGAGAELEAPAGPPAQQAAPASAGAAAQDGSELAEMVWAAQTLADLERAGARVSRAVASGEIKAGVSNALARTLTERRQVLAAQAKHEDPEDAEGVALLTDQGVEAGALLDRIVDGRRRARALEALRAAVAEDLEWFPDDLLEDPDRATKALAEAGLDAFGEPV